MYVKDNIEGRLCNHYWSCNAINIIQGVLGGMINILGGGSVDYSE
jgi:hypothetical protein